VAPGTNHKPESRQRYQYNDNEPLKKMLLFHKPLTFRVSSFVETRSLNSTPRS
jgi:hypothetical protein